jgi:6-pyruvoyltetrahydropterin/6-carboxytetrahydropterin synthase
MSWWSISKDFYFSASHVLSHLPPEHPCARLHGHNFVVRIEVGNERLDERGFVLDYHELAPVGRWLDETFDHKHLNDVVPDVLPTAEVMASLVWQFCESIGIPVVRVGWSETPKTWCWYSDMFLVDSLTPEPTP